MMSNNFSRYYLEKFHYLPIHCIFCGQKVLPGEDEKNIDINPCKHTLFILTDEVNLYLANRTIEQLKAKGFKVAEDTTGSFDIAPPSEYEDLDIEETIDQVEFDEGLKVVQYPGSLIMISTYVGFSPTNDEVD